MNSFKTDNIDVYETNLPWLHGSGNDILSHLMQHLVKEPREIQFYKIIIFNTKINLRNHVKKMGTSKASSPQGYQFTGLRAC
jgi:hypothetical protein